MPARRRPWRRLFPRDPVVLMYHGFCDARRDDDPENLWVEAGRFEAQLEALRHDGWHALDLDGYLAWRRTGRRPAPRSFLVTIDDALESVATHAAPVLERTGVPAVVYVPADLMGATAHWLPEPADEPILAGARVRDLAARPGVEMALHGGDHRSMVGLGDVDLKGQVGTARDTLEVVTGRPVRSFAYPFGDHDRRARGAVRDGGFDHAFSVYDDAGAFAISRVDINATDTLASFRLKVGLPAYRVFWRLLQPVRIVRRAVRGFLTHEPARTSA